MQLFPSSRRLLKKDRDLAIEENPAIETGAIIYKGELRRLPGMRTSTEEEE